MEEIRSETFNLEGGKVIFGLKDKSVVLTIEDKDSKKASIEINLPIGVEISKTMDRYLGLLPRNV